MTERTAIENAMAIGEAYFVGEETSASFYTYAEREPAEAMAAHLRSLGLRRTRVFTSEEVAAAKAAAHTAVATAQAAVKQVEEERAARMLQPGLK